MSRKFWSNLSSAPDGTREDCLLVLGNGDDGVASVGDDGVAGLEMIVWLVLEMMVWLV